MHMLRYISRIFERAVKGFMADDCFSKASSLTFYTLLSLVPVLAVAFGIAKGFGFEQFLEYEIKRRWFEQPELAEQIIQYAYSSLTQAHGGVIATVGLIALLWTSIQLFGHVENYLNTIWDVKTHRSFLRALTDFLALLILAPIFIVLSSSLLVYTVTLLERAKDSSSLISTLSPYLRLGLHFVPFLINWFLFSFVYLFIPNTKVLWKNALMAGIIAGTSYHIVQWIYIQFQIGVASYGAVYGSLAALPLFLVWVNTSWMIVLFGAEIAYQLEISPRRPEHTGPTVSRKQIGYLIGVYCAQAFLQGKTPVTEVQIATDIGVSLRIVRQVTEALCTAGLLVEDKNHAFVMAKNPINIKVKDLLDALDDRSEVYLVKATDANLKSLAILRTFDESAQSASKNIL